MNLPLEIVFRNMKPSPAVEAKVRERAVKLEQFCDDIMSCRVVVELSHKRHRHGNLYDVRIDLRVRGAELASGRGPGARQAHEDVYVAVRDAFDAMRRQVEDYTRRRRGEVKQHAVPPHGRVAELHEDHGTIATPDGRTIYFHRNSLVDADFDKLDLGAEVRFAEEAGDLGPQASTVHVVGKHHIAG